MINLPNQQELEELQTFHDPFCLTVYAPLITPNGATNPNRIAVKNLLAEADKALQSAGASPEGIRKTLLPARQLLENHEFWPIHHASLALFMHPRLFRYYHVPDHITTNSLTVGNGFNLDPLLQAMHDNQQYYVLVLGHKNVRLFEGDHYNLKPVHLKHFPADMKEILAIDEYPKIRQTHTIAPTGVAQGSEASHGQYNVSQTDKAMLQEFFRWIDRHLHNFLNYHQRPLIIAGVNYLLAIYRKVNTYPGLASQAITGNQDYVDLIALRDRARQLVGEGKP